MAKIKYEEYIVKVVKGKTYSVMDLNVDQLREELCRIIDILEDIDAKTSSIVESIDKWRLS